MLEVEGAVDIVVELEDLAEAGVVGIAEAVEPTVGLGLGGHDVGGDGEAAADGTAVDELDSDFREDLALALPFGEGEGFDATFDLVDGGGDDFFGGVGGT